MLSEFEIQAIIRGYMECALWASNDEATPDGGEPMDANYDLGDFSLELLDEIDRDVREFVAANEADVALCALHGEFTFEGVGHDYWLTRNGHGAGFWDREYGHQDALDAGQRLTKACQYTEYHLYIGDDDQIYGMRG